MSFETIKDFDFGVGPNIKICERVSQSPDDISKKEVDFIKGLLLEIEFRRVRRKVRQIVSRTQEDGDNGEDEDDGDDEDEIDRPMEASNQCLVNEKLQIARKFAEKALQSTENGMVWQDLEDNYRESILVQLCRNTELELLEGTTSIHSVPEIFTRLRSSKFRSKFNVKESIGKGQFGEVFLVTKEGDRFENQYAVKKITPSESLLDVRAAIMESKILKRLRGHKNIVDICDYWLEIEPGSEISCDDDEYEEGPLKFYIQLEYCAPTLADWIVDNHNRGVCPEREQVLTIAKQLFEGLCHIHHKNILHLDINPKNILWKDPSCTVIKIVDFGLAVIGTSHNSADGTFGYIAPELPLTAKSDIYSAAVAIVEIAKTVYTKIELIEIIKEKRHRVGIDGLDETLTLSLDDNPSRRPTASDVVMLLSNL